MSRLVDRPQSFGRYPGVDLSCGNGGVTEKLLNNPNIGAVIEHMRGAAMPEHVWS